MNNDSQNLSSSSSSSDETIHPSQVHETPTLGSKPENVKIEQKEFIDYPSLFSILSAHHIDEDNKLRFGIQEKKLLELLKVKQARLKHLLKTFQEEISPFGLQIITFKDEGVNWITLRQEKYAPLELTRPAEILLGFSLGHFMELPKPEYKAEDFRLELTVRGFLTNAEYTNALDELVKKRYLRRSRGIIRLGVRAELEFSEKDRQTIGLGALQLLRGKDTPSISENKEL